METWPSEDRLKQSSNELEAIWQRSWKTGPARATEFWGLVKYLKKKINKFQKTEKKSVT